MKQALSLSPISSVHLLKMREWRNDKRIYSWCRQFEPISEGHHQAWYERIQTDPKIKMYAVIAEAPFPTEAPDKWGTHQFIVGVCGLTDIDYINRRAEFSLYIGPEFHGSGFGAEALRALLAHGFNVLNLNCIWGEAFEGNGAIKMFKNLGFKEECRRRQFYYREGKYIDAILVSILKDEFNGNDIVGSDRLKRNNFNATGETPKINGYQNDWDD